MGYPWGEWVRWDVQEVVPHLSDEIVLFCGRLPALRGSLPLNPICGWTHTVGQFMVTWDVT